MRITRVLVAGIIAIALSSSAAAAWADDSPVVDPPPLVTPAPSDPPPDPAPTREVPAIESPPLNPTTSSFPTGVYEAPISQPEAPVDPYAGETQEEGWARILAEGAARGAAFQERYGAASMRWMMAHPGQGLVFSYDDGVFTDMSGAAVDIGATTDELAAADLNAPIADTSPAALAEIVLFDSPSESGSTEVDATPTAVPAPPMPEESSDLLPGLAGFAALALAAFWRRRLRALELLRKLGPQ